MINETEITNGRIPFNGTDTPNYDVINSCIHCGMCLSSCPTYRENGLEMSSPRGRILLMKGVADGRIGMESDIFQQEMGECLNCRACEAVCPSGVLYGEILEASRVQIQRAREDGTLPSQSPLVKLIRTSVFDLLFKRPALFRLFSRMLWLYQKTGVQTLARRLGILKLLKLDEAEVLLPPVSDRFVVPKGQVYEAEGQSLHHVALMTGCIMSTAFADVHEATIRVLQKNGCTVILPPDQACCGALHTHGGDLDGGRDLARRNIAAFEALGVAAIVVNAAGCGSTMKEYGHLLKDDPAWAERAKAFSAKVKDINEFLVSIDFNTRDLKPVSMKLTYQEPCHLAHAQRITAQPRKLLKSIPGLQLVEMKESSMCCGSAGVYNITQPEMAGNLGNRKLDNAEASGADVVVTANPGCHAQLLGGLQLRDSHMHVKHIVEVLDQSYRGM
ncbi:MAG: 4Fe-4S dicluster domain-containing protein [Chloroflexi bacterium AL-W]|nr:4Fe-4S dicluster domain-containing protein [Chloroflexi bacterium AL-N1]NOK71352.1 4Fe-4S dicluster domain-containing protein [Chloroflexi bacterium AL-N10]NOK78755.1 4Fe-4S dicluster domain-containing protein [Chloroflexi bacterium AL-N5]NOK86125.1 4Fe-4S dicluster domain-containing protein [Chloroflexi bacterium AL-W]NOK93078.1 4Fe-4S dicluster domain-containing protein [Chloroflexi bacterium AL-N15]